MMGDECVLHLQPHAEHLRVVRRALRRALLARRRARRAELVPRRRERVAHVAKLAPRSPAPLPALAAADPKRFGSLFSPLRLFGDLNFSLRSASDPPGDASAS